MLERRTALVSFLLAWVLVTWGCGAREREAQRTRVEPAPADSGEVLNVLIAGRTVLVPAPPGMLDALSRTKEMYPGASFPHARDSDVRAILVPAAEWRRTKHGGKPSQEFVAFVSVEKGDQSKDGLNTFHYSRTRDRWLSPGAWSRRPESQRLAAALKAWRAGAHEELSAPLALAEDDPITVEVRSPDVRFVEELTVGRRPGTPAGLCDVFASATVLVRERVVKLMWARTRVPLRVGTLAETSDGVAQWADAVLQANP